MPQRTLLLERGFFVWQLIPRTFISLFMLPFLLGPPFVILASLTGEISAQGQSTGTPGEVLVMVLFCFVWYGMLWLFLNFAGVFFGDYSRLEIDRRRANLSTTFSGWLVYGWRQYEVVLSDIEAVQVEVQGPSGESLVLSLDVKYASNRGDRESLDVGFKVRDLDTKREALALVYAVANIVGLEHRRITRSDHLETELELSREATGPGWKEVPPIASDLTFKDPEAGPEGRVVQTAEPEAVEEVNPPELELPPFDPDSFKVALEAFVDSELEWDPGRRVRIRRSKLGTGWTLCAALGMGLLAGVVLPLFVGKLLSGIVAYAGLSVVWWHWGFVVGGVVALTTWIRMGRKYGRKEVVFDWDEEVVTIQSGQRSLRKPLSSIRTFLLEGHYKTRDDRPNKYYCRLWVELDESREHILTSAEYSGRDEAYRKTGSMVEELATALNVPWEWEDFERVGGVRRIFALGRSR